MSGTVSGRVIHIDPTAPAGGDGSLNSPYNAWGTFLLSAGDTVLQRGDTTTGSFAITTQGSAGQPITVGSYGAGRAIVEGSVVLAGASHVTVENLDIRGGDGIGVIIEGGSSAVTVRDCEIHDGMSGVSVKGAGALSIAVQDCDIHDNDHAGIWLDSAIAAEGQEIRLEANTIWRNGQQGILLHGSWVVADGNTVVNNGLSGLPGLSGIHALGVREGDPAGRHNAITGNTVAFQRDGSSVDGNGIMLDHWSGDTLVSGNHVFGNDGSGISLLSSSGNQVLDNIVHDNMADAGGTHVAARAELFLGETDLAPGLATGNLFSGNTAASNSRYGAAVQIDAAAASDPSNGFTGNLLSQAGAGALWISDLQGGTSLADWNALPRTGADLAPPAPLPTEPGFDPAMLDTAFTIHSSLLAGLGGGGLSMLVAHGDAKDITGGPDGSSIAGDGRDNILTGIGGRNLISAGAGNAVLLGGPGNDLLFGGAGDTLLIAGSGNTLMIGGAGRSRLFGGAGNDLLFAGNGTGDKLLDGGGGENLLAGGDGADIFRVGGTTDVVLNFTSGQDLLDVSRLGVAGLAGLTLVGDATGGAILDSTGALRVVLAGIDVHSLTAGDFLFTAPTASAAVALDGPPLALAEGGATTDFTFSVTRTGDLSRADCLAWQVAGSGPNPADAADFVGAALPAGHITFVAGEAQRTITIQVAGDSLAEPEEGFTLTLSPVTDIAAAVAAASATILDDDADPNTAFVSIAPADADRPEGDSGTTLFTFTVTRSGDTGTAAGASYTVAGSGLRPASADDFAGASLPSGTVSFAAGETARTITIAVAGDTLVETHETFQVILAAPEPGTRLATATATGTIRADDLAGDLAVLDTGTNQALVPAPDFYTGPVAGIEKEFILVTPANINVSASGANWFIRSGSGADALAAHGGRNVLDGGAGSNFLVGASGEDTFFLDARGASAEIWSTVLGFGAGDSATVWGVSRDDFTIAWQDGLGATGATGLTMLATAPGGPTAALTLADYTLDDVTNGRLQVSYGAIDPATPYLYLYGAA